MDEMSCHAVTSFMDLPDEVLAHILSYLPLLDLYNTRLVSARLCDLVEDSRYSHTLWASACLESTTWPSYRNLSIIERAARHGNIEALIKLAVAYLYSQGVPDGPGKGTINAFNGQKASNYLKRAESLVTHRQPFSWVFIRPPFATTCVCCKACVCHNMKNHCISPNKELIPSLFYVVGKAMSHYENHEVEERRQAYQWFKQGSLHGCPYSSFENWKTEQCFQDEVQSVRQLRKIVTSRDTCIDAQFELGKLYAKGKFGGITRFHAYQYVQQIVRSSPSLLSASIYDAQPDVNEEMVFILLDWIVEVAEMKSFSTKTLHLAISLIQRYMVARKLKRSRLQLLGVTALLLAARWTAVPIITIREAAWLTDNTYRYDEVVCMMGEIVSTLHGEIQKPTVPDYLEMFELLVNADKKSSCLAAYVSESAVLFPDFGRYTAAQIAAGCLLLARVLLEQELPWPSALVEATGLTVPDLYHCTSLLYSKCLTDDGVVTDYRGVKLCAIKTRYSDERFLCISEMEFMNYYMMKDKLGVRPYYQRRSSNSSLLKYRELVSQSFVEEFDAQSLSDVSFVTSPLPPIVPSSADGYSPRASIDSFVPSPIIFEDSNSCSSPSPSSSSSSSSPTCERQERPVHSIKKERRKKKERRHSSNKLLSSSLPLLPGIEPLVISEETVGFNSSLMVTQRNVHTPPTSRRKSLLQHWNSTIKASSNHGHSPIKANPVRKGQRRPLSSLASSHCSLSNVSPVCNHEEGEAEMNERGLEPPHVPRPASSREEREDGERSVHNHQHKALQVEKRAFSDQNLLLTHNKRHRSFKSNNCM
ncbi:PREDICTED: cyclin-F-like [Amphimedon queenslandica]|uniref:Cyclin-F n=1 Tax=Amphimedon queenslandica TaxID=400682 RepID=A0A1X7U857_AMPQE|nr:PREDICTED: cyclin-F-like [Amphimedon queenslandica]|eukprot:XP_019855606.1 PREDICTED: cyclin-F-like [Amphimedon queenslandica]